MREREERRTGPHRVEALPRTAVEFELRRAVSTHDFDVAPPHLLRVSGAERRDRRFLRGEASGKMNSRLATALALRDLPRREDPLDETFALAPTHADDAGDVRGIDAEADDGGYANMILPLPDAAFEWRDTAFGPALVCLPLEEDAPHLFTTRAWPLGQAGAHRRVWADVAVALGASMAELVRLQQVHRAGIVVADGLPRAAQDALPEADIVLARDAGRVIAVQAADCVPLLIADRRLGVVAAAHAGAASTALSPLTHGLTDWLPAHRHAVAASTAALAAAAAAQAKVAETIRRHPRPRMRMHRRRHASAEAASATVAST